MHEPEHLVWGFFVHQAVTSAQAHGLDGHRLLHGLPFDHDDLACPGYRLRWREVVQVASRIHAHLGDGGAEDVGAHIAESTPLHRTLTETLSKPATAYRVIISLWGLVCPLRFERFEVSGSSLSWIVGLTPGAAPSLGTFHMITGALRGLPRLYGRPDALVSSEVREDGGIYEVHFGDTEPPRREGVAARHAATSLLEALSAFDREARGAILAQILDLLEEPDRRSATLLLQERLGLTRTEARVATRLADGHALAAIAAELNIADATVRTHLRNIFRKTSTGRQAELVALVHRTLGG
ncbi:MAG: hypothetical protein KF901_08070 [Myxococcales bacterium]|nr:hypothetical protein [Myxococcales bacterium]